MQSIEDTAIRRIRECGRSSVFSARRFLDLGNEESIRKSLQTLTDRCIIQRLAMGVYDYPKQHPLQGAPIPTPDTIAKATAGRVNARRTSRSGSGSSRSRTRIPSVPGGRRMSRAELIKMTKSE